MDLYTTSLMLSGLAVSDEEIYFSTVESSTYVGYLLTCPKTGCVLAPQQVASMTKAISNVTWLADGTIVFESAPAQSTTRPALYGCPDTGCSGTLDSFASDGLNGFYGGLTAVGDRVVYLSGGNGPGFTACSGGVCPAGNYVGVRGAGVFTADEGGIYFVERSTEGGSIVSCPYVPETTEVCVPTELVAGDQTITTAMDVYLGQLYWVMPGRDDFNEGEVRHCSVSAGCSDVQPLAEGLDSPAELVVDEDGAFWLTQTPPVLQHCAAGACPGGTRTLATNLSAPELLTTDADFVYWVDGTTIRRLAK